MTKDIVEDVIRLTKCSISRIMDRRSGGMVPERMCERGESKAANKMDGRNLKSMRVSQNTDVFKRSLSRC